MSTTTTLTIMLSGHDGKIVLEVKKGGVIVVDLPKKDREALQRASITAGYGLQGPPMRNLGVSYQLGKQRSLEIGSELRIFIRQTERHANEPVVSGFVESMVAKVTQ